MPNRIIDEFSYREDYRMGNPVALYSNEIHFNLRDKVMITSTVAILAAPNGFLNSNYKSDREPQQTELFQKGYNATRERIPAEQTIKQDRLVVANPYQKLQAYVSNLFTLPYNWDFEGSKAPSRLICENAVKFIGSMERNGFKCPLRDEVSVSAFSTIVFDIEVPRGEISIEIGPHSLGFFTDYIDGINKESNGTPTDFNTIPVSLMPHLIKA